MCWVTQDQFRSRQMRKIFKIHPVHSLFVYNKNDKSCLKNLIMVRFQLIRMSSYAKIKLQMCWATQRQCRSRQMWKIFSNSTSTLNFYLFQKMTCLDWTIHSWQDFQLITMSSYAKNKQQMCRVTQHQCNVAKCGKYSQIHPVHWLFVYYKKKLSWLNNLFMVMFQLIRMSSYAKNKPQMCWVTEHQCRSRQMRKILTNSSSILTFCLLLKMSCFAWTIYSW